ncbi:hypothetical protein ACPXAU_24525, partial [Salmonella enterica]|uniref:hypothetical protein n=1 Tax=Salmonella enterica TaxID=28901 RepID=UPI003CF84635
IDLMGNKYGRLTVIGVAESRRKPSGALMSYWLCECDCGTKKEISGEALRDGRVITCGCGVKERIAKLNYSHGMSNI